MTGFFLELLAGALLVAGFAYLALVAILAGVLLGALLGTRRAGRLALAALFVLALSSPASASAEEKREEGALFRALGWGVYATAGGDLLSTELMLSAGHVELNPIGRDWRIRYPAKVGGAYLLNAATAKLHREGKTKTALWTRIAIVSLWGYATAHNLRLALK